MAPGQAAHGRCEGWRQAVIGACLLAPCVALLWVPLFAAGTPRTLGVPFFYCYMFAWVGITPLLMVIAYVLLRHPPSGSDWS